MLTFHIHDTISGDHLHEIRPVPDAVTWRATILGTGEARGAVMLRDADTGFSRSEARDLFTPHARMLCVREGAHVGFAGVIQGIPAYSFKTGALSFQAVEFPRVWDDRYTFGVDAYEFGDLSFTGKSAAGAVRAWLDRGMQHGNSEWAYPVDLPADGAGGFSEDVRYEQDMRISDGLQRIASQGYEIHHRPYIHASGALRFQIVVASRVVYDETDLPLSVEESAIIDPSVALSGRNQVTGVLGRGNGSGPEDPITRHAPDPIESPIIPIRDVIRVDSTILDGTALQRFANAEYARDRFPVEQWSMGVRLSDEVPLSAVQPGQILNVDVRGDSWVADGNHPMRVIALSGNASESVSVEVQPYA